MRRFFWHATWVGYIAALTANGLTANGQDGLPYVIEPHATSTSYGMHVLAGEDLDGDDFGDLLVAAPHERALDDNPTIAWHLYSGRTGMLVRSFVFDPPELLSGNSNGAFVSDIDGDGITDLVFGYHDVSSRELVHVGVVRVHSGGTGALLWERWGSAAADYCGRDVVGVDDFNGDGVNDVAVVARWSESGLVDIWSGIDGATLASIPISWPRRFAFAADLDRDGRRDLLVGRTQARALGIVALSLPSLDVVFELTDECGWNLAASETDFNDDDVGDFVASTRTLSDFDLRSGADGSIIRHFTEGGYGFAFGDVDSNGAADLTAIVASSFGESAILVLDPLGGQTLRKYDRYGSSNTVWGDEMGLADVNGDGASDIVLGRRELRDATVQAGAPIGLQIDGFVALANVTRGAAIALEVIGARPGSRVRFLYSARGKDCTYLPRLGDCVDLTRPVVLIEEVVADAEGRAALEVDIAADAPTRAVWLQALQMGRHTATSNVLQLEIVE